MNTINKIALGTVQFGIDYGISNTNGQVPLSEVEKILSFCVANNITTLDTAQGYGNSESILGMFDISSFRIITKLTENAHLDISLENLNVDKVYAVMLHREDELNDATFNTIKTYKNEQLADKIGVSVYSPEKLQEIISKYDIDIVQFPLNLLDHRFISLIPSLKKKNIEIHTRSAFLQGLLLMDLEKIPTFFNSIKTILSKITEPKLEHTLGFLKNIPQIDSIVVGCTNCNELEEIVTAYHKDIPYIDYTSFCVAEEKYINPSQWEIHNE